MSDSESCDRRKDICEQFELDWASGERPDLSLCLDLVPEREQHALLVELLQIELFWRREESPLPRTEHFKQRFPRLSAAIEEGFHKFTAPAVPTAELQFDPKATTPPDVQSPPTRNAVRKGGTPKTIGPYRILQPIGQGGMGQVFLAEQQEPVKRRVALKIISSEAPTEKILARFDAERQALAMMDHQNIARVLDAGVTEDGQPYFAMELVRGIAITEFCDQNRLSVNERLELFVQTCRAIQHAHQKGIIHRDLKPSNVLVTLCDGKPMAKVIDFGLAKAMHEQILLTNKTLFTAYGQVVGTLEYMSPEQAELNSLDIDTRTDVYSLGVILYELLTGSTPIGRDRLRSEAFDRILALIREEEATRPSNRLSESGDAITGISNQRKTDPRRLNLVLKGDLDWIAIKALEKDRSRRFDGAAALGDDVERFLRGDAIIARPPSWRYRFQKTYEKNQAAILFAASTSLLLVAALFATTSLWLRATKDRTRAVDAERKASERSIELQAEKYTVENERNRLRQAESEYESLLARAHFTLATVRRGQDRLTESKVYLERIPSKHRSVEWHLTQQLLEGSDITWTQDVPSEPIAFNSSGSQVASAEEEVVKLWNPRSIERPRKMFGHQGRVTSLSYSGNGQRLASGSRDKTIKIWDAEAGLEQRTLTGHLQPVRDVAFSYNGDLIASGSDDHTVRVWDSATGENVVTFKEHDGRVGAVCLNRDASRLVSVGPSRLIVWDLESRRKIFETTTKGPCSDVTYSPNGSTFASAHDDGSIKVWNADTFEVSQILRHQQNVNCIEFSSDGTRLLVGGGTINAALLNVWNLQNRANEQAFLGHTSYVADVSFDADGDRFVSTSIDGTIKVWDTRTASYARNLSGTEFAKRYSVPVISTSYSRDGRRFCRVTNEDASIWDAVQFKRLQRWRPAGVSVINCSAFSPNGDVIAIARQESLGKPNEIEVWPLDRKMTDTWKPPGTARSLCFSSDGGMLAAGDRDGTIRIWNVDEETLVGTLGGLDDPVECVAFSPRGDQILATDGSVVLLQDLNSNVIKTLFDVESRRPFFPRVEQVGFSPDGNRIVVMQGPKIVIWDDQLKQRIAVLPAGNNEFAAFAVCPDGSRIASATSPSSQRMPLIHNNPTVVGGEISIWNLTNGEETMTISDQKSPVTSLSFSPRGTTLLAGDHRGSVQIWDWNRSGDEERIYRAMKSNSMSKE